MINRLNMRATPCWLLLRWLKRTPPTAAGSRLTLGIVDRTLLLLLLVILVKKLQVQNQDMKSIHSTLSTYLFNMCPLPSTYMHNAECTSLLKVPLLLISRILTDRLLSRFAGFLGWQVAAAARWSTFGLITFMSDCDGSLLARERVVLKNLYIYWAFKSEYTEAFKKKVSQK